MARSFDSGTQPFNSHHRYESTNNADPEFNPNFRPRKRGASPWIKFGIPILIIAIIAAVVGGVLGSRKSSSSASSSSSGDPSPGSSSQSAAAQASAAKNLGVFFTATDGYGLPVYPQTTNSAAYGKPTFNPSATNTWPADPTSFASPAATSARSDRPRLIAPKYKWDALPAMIPNDAYLKSWNATIFGNASDIMDQDVLKYTEDGGLTGSGVLDIARELKVRIKTLAYCYRISNETKYAQRALRELQNAAGNNTSNPFGTAPDRWNTAHFLDLAEFTAAFAIGYDWLYDYWQPSERNDIKWSILNLGLHFGIQGYTNSTVYYAWWRSAGNNIGNWNCVCNSGLTLGALAILGDDTSGMAEQMLGLTVPNAQTGCAFGPVADGSWSETPNYWYFGTTAHAEMTSSLLSATGSDYNLLTANPAFHDTATFHMYVTGMTSLFNYGDHGPNKYSTTANGMFFYGSQYKSPQFTLMQRDRLDAPDPYSMFWYDPSVTGAFWADLALDHYFDNGSIQWASMRSSWTDNTGTYIAMKAGNHTGHQAHGDLDAGDFVLDAMGERWAGELGSGQYLSTNYFSNETQTSDRWLYYRKRTEGQNTIVVNNENQIVNAQPDCQYGSSNTTQPGGTTVFTVPDDSTAFFTADLTTTYGGTNIVRGIRFINARKQILLQDDITNAATTSQWRMHTNATVDLSGASATLTMPSSGKKMSVQILDPPSGIVFTKGAAVRNTDDPPVPTSTDPQQQAWNEDQPNDGVTVLQINIPTGTSSIKVLFNPQWDGMSADKYKTPPSVPVASWSLRSHDS